MADTETRHESALDKGEMTRRLAWLALLVIVIATAAVRWRLLDVPLERDEGEYAYGAQMILRGFAPYEGVYNMKLPGIYGAYAVVLALFGETHRGIHLGLLAINAATIALVFLLGRHLLGATAGLVAAASFALLSVGQWVLGVFANAEHFVLLPALAGVLLLVRACEARQSAGLVGGALLLGLAFLMKQHGIAFVAFGGLYVLLDELAQRPLLWGRLVSRCAAFALAAAAPFGLLCGVLWIAGVFDTFWFWTVDYARAYVGRVPLEYAPVFFRMRATPVASAAPLVWALAGLGLTTIFWDPGARERRGFIALFTLFSVLAICPGFFFRSHYFVLTLPAAALLAGAAISGLANLLSKTKSRVLRYGAPIGLAVLCLAVSIFQQRAFLFTLSPTEVARSTYGLNPFPESLEIARFIAEHTAEDDLIAVIGSEPQLYFYSGRRAATGYVYTYPLMEEQPFALEMQEEMIAEIEAARPEMFIFVSVPQSWLAKPTSPSRIFEWAESYGPEHYRTVGLVEIFEDSTVYHWAPEAIPPPRSQNWIAVLQRRSGSS